MRHRGALVHVDSIDLALYASALQGFAKVLNHHNCESDLALRRAVHETNPAKRAFLRMEAGRLARFEHSLCGCFEVNIVVCEEDRQRLTDANPGGHFHAVENGVDTEHFSPTGTTEEPYTAIFTGTLGWRPNLSAAEYLAKEIWPRVKERCPNARLYLAGKDPPAELFRLARAGTGIEVFADPEDMRPLLARAAVFVCPVLEGGGTRVKILDAMATAKPVISTTVGCEGLRVTPGKDILVADTPREFADVVLDLLKHPERCKRIGEAARTLVEHEYGWERIGRQLQGAYECAAGAGKCIQLRSAEAVGDSV